MKKIIIKTIIEPIVELFDNEDNLIGEIKNSLELYDVRVQIKEAELNGHYIIYKGQQIFIDRRGELERYPDGMYDHASNLLMKLVGF